MSHDSLSHFEVTHNIANYCIITPGSHSENAGI